MIRRFFIFFILTISLFGCSYDDTGLKNRVDDIENRLTRLETLCNQLNTNISSLQTLVEALQNRDYISAVTPILNNGKIAGYTVSFGSMSPITLYHMPEPGEAADWLPVIGAKMADDGEYYWTLDGEWLTDSNGKRIPTTGTDGTTPTVKLVNDSWMVSYDDGETWTNLGSAVSDELFRDLNLIKNIIDTGDNYTFELADGTLLTLPKGSVLELIIEDEGALMMKGNMTRDVEYKVLSSHYPVQIEVIPSGDVKCVVNEQTDSTGYFRIATGRNIDEFTRVVVLVSNGNKVLMKRIVFEDETLKIVDNAEKEVMKEGGGLALEFLSNIEWSYEISDNGLDWIHALESRAVNSHTLNFTVDENGDTDRSATIDVSGGKLKITYTIVQRGDKELSVERRALEDFFVEAGGPHWTVRTNWITDAPVSRWHGVETDNSGKVIGIDLSGNNLSGRLSDIICRLKHLSYLRLGNNNLTGNLPDSIITLRDLKDLVVRNNCLEGVVSDEINNSRKWQQEWDLKEIIPQKSGYKLNFNHYTSTDYSRHLTVNTLQRHSKGPGITVVFMGDGYTDRDIADGTYDSLMEKSSEMFFALEPFTSFRDYFDVYSITLVSPNDFVDGFWNEPTPLTTSFSVDKQFLSWSTYDVMRTISTALKIEDLTDVTSVVIMNNHWYSFRAQTLWWENQYSLAFCFGTETAPDLICHEANGHGFGKLEDEYIENSGFITEERKNRVINGQTDFGWFANVDLESDPTKVLWADFLRNPDYESENIGVYEGASLFAQGIYRATENSIMRDNEGGFNAPSRLSLYRRIKELAGEEYSYDDFLKYDKKNLVLQKNENNILSKTIGQQTENLGNPPIVITHPSSVKRDFTEGISANHPK